MFFCKPLLVFKLNYKKRRVPTWRKWEEKRSSSCNEGKTLLFSSRWSWHDSHGSRQDVDDNDKDDKNTSTEENRQENQKEEEEEDTQNMILVTTAAAAAHDTLGLANKRIYKERERTRQASLIIWKEGGETSLSNISSLLLFISAVLFKKESRLRNDGRSRCRSTQNKITTSFEGLTGRRRRRRNSTKAFNN